MNVNYLFLLLLVFLSTFSHASVKVEFFTLSQSFSNILPVKQLIEDDWQQSPENKASDGFTQNEVGIRSYWQNFSFSLSHRYDYFVFSNPDTAKAFKLCLPFSLFSLSPPNTSYTYLTLEPILTPPITPKVM